jgi:hypothetical protein
MADDIIEETIDEINSGRMSRHPIRTAGSAFLIGLGAGMMATKMRKEKTPFQQFMDKLGM